MTFNSFSFPGAHLMSSPPGALSFGLTSPPSTFSPMTSPTMFSGVPVHGGGLSEVSRLRDLMYPNLSIDSSMPSTVYGAGNFKLPHSPYGQSVYLDNSSRHAPLIGHGSHSSNSNTLFGDPAAASTIMHRPSLDRLRSNPMFHDLQMLLAHECSHLKVPASLITASWNMSTIGALGHAVPQSFAASSSPLTPGIHRPQALGRQYTPGRSTTLDVYTQHMQLQDRFIRLRLSHPEQTQVLMQVESYYSTEVGKLEMARYQALATTLHDDHTKLALNAYYDKERTTLVKKIQTMLDNRLGVSSGTSSSSMPGTSASHHQVTDVAAPLNFSSETRPGENANASDQNSPSGDSDVSVNSADFDDELFIKSESGRFSSSEKDDARFISPSDFGSTFPEKKCLGNLNTPSMMGLPTQEQCSSDGSTPESETSHGRGRKRLFQEDQPSETTDLDKPKKRQRQLNGDATKVLSDWYDKNMHYPYPSDQTVEELANSGGITSAQVKKWMANKRVRSYNTLSFSGNAHPIKFKFQKKKKSNHGVASPEDADKENIDPSNDSSSSGTGICKPLQAKARKVLSDWYNTHLYNPYPTDDEKLSLAMQGGVTVSQVKSWFANKRSRTNNTRRQVPNYFIKKYPSYLPYIEMISSRRRSSKVKVEPQVVNMSPYPTMQQLSY